MKQNSLGMAEVVAATMQEVPESLPHLLSGQRPDMLTYTDL